MHTDEMKCPLRTDENGEFAPCYGEKCMAYYEYEIPFLGSLSCSANQEPIKQSACRRLGPAPYGCV